MAALNCCVQALLHAISKGLLDIVRVIIDHPNYSLQETQQQQSQTDCKLQSEERIQYKCSPDITPIMLAAHMYVSSPSPIRK